MLVTFTSREAGVWFEGNEGNYILGNIAKQGYISREFLVNGIWLPEPQTEVQGQRYRLGEVRCKIEELAKTWRYLKNRNIQQPVRPNEILEQLAIARLKPENLRLFSPWGPRYKKRTPMIRESDTEIATLREIRCIFEQLKGNGYILNFILMPADIYGTEINGLAEQFVLDYFKSLTDAAYREIEGVASILVKPWSLIRSENNGRYSELEREINQNFKKQVEKGEYENAVKVAKFFNPKQPEESARRYCIERLVEAIMISETFDPVKLSIVRKQKDTLDGSLKRIYIIENRAPWLGGE